MMKVQKALTFINFKHILTFLLSISFCKPFVKVILGLIFSLRLNKNNKNNETDLTHNAYDNALRVYCVKSLKSVRFYFQKNR